MKFDLSKPTDYLNRQMFLDPAGGVTIQRFEECRYPKIQKFESVARGFFWTPEEITLTQDRSDHKKATDTVRFVFTENLLRQTSLDSLQSPGQVLGPVASVPEVDALGKNWDFWETNIHSNSYSHIIRQIYNVPKDQFNTIHENSHIIEMASSIGDYYNALHILNSKKVLGMEVSEYDHIKAIWLALNASLGLEAIRFLCSFATSFAMVENKIYMGNGNIISLIAQDELLHTEWTTYIINQVVKDDPRFAQVKRDCEAEVQALYEDVIREEKAWAQHIFSRGVVVGLNQAILESFVDYTATERLKMIGLKPSATLKSNPIPWYNKHMGKGNKQTALQESEATNYLISAVSSDINYSELPDL